MPWDKKCYPSDWTTIRQHILDRARHRCEQCGVMNHQWGYREKGVFSPVDKILLQSQGYHRTPFFFEGTKIIMIILTIAHKNHDTTDNREENLAAWCQACHLRHDQQLHQNHARITRRQKKYVGQGELFVL